MIDGTTSLNSDDAIELYYHASNEGNAEETMDRNVPRIAIRSCCDEWLGDGLRSAQYMQWLD